jgi:hypothetical protein
LNIATLSAGRIMEVAWRQLRSAHRNEAHGAGFSHRWLTVDFALFMAAAIENDELVHEAAAIAGCRTPSAFAHAAAIGDRMNADSRGGRIAVQP